jgi:hypothetical protein
MRDLEVDEELKEKMQSLIESREPEQYNKDITLIHAEWIDYRRTMERMQQLDRWQPFEIINTAESAQN